jgi:hypothetical protein
VFAAPAFITILAAEALRARGFPRAVALVGVDARPTTLVGRGSGEVAPAGPR